MAFCFLVDIENQVQTATALGAVAGNENLVAVDAFDDAAVPALQGVGANKPPTLSEALADKGLPVFPIFKVFDNGENAVGDVDDAEAPVVLEAEPSLRPVSIW